MLFNFFKIVSIIPILFLHIKSPAKEIDLDPITISGFTEMVNINENIPFNLVMVEGHPFIRLDIKIYVNDNLELSSKVISKYISKDKYYISGFTDVGQIKRIKVVVNYEDPGVEDTYCEFDLYSPQHKTFVCENEEIFLPDDYYPTSVGFYMQGDVYQITPNNENSIINGKPQINLENTRFIDLSKYSITVNANIEKELESCELRVYEKFVNSGFTYINDEYTSIDINLIKNGNVYTCANEYRFYINKYTGMIMQTYSSSCEGDALPFFIPYSLGYNKTIKFALVFSDIGYHCGTYIYIGEIKIPSLPSSSNDFGSVLNYKYVSISEPLIGIKYA